MEPVNHFDTNTIGKRRHSGGGQTINIAPSPPPTSAFETLVEPPQQQQQPVVTTTLLTSAGDATLPPVDTAAYRNCAELKLTLTDGSGVVCGEDEATNGRLPDIVVEAKFAEVSECGVDEEDGGGEDAPLEETYFTVAIQVFIPFLIAGFGMVFAGLALDRIQHWPVFEEVTELVILIPALLGLKGNLEMTLASRLSTQANLGHMDTTKQQISMILGNLTLIQCQAIVVGFLGSMVAVLMGGLKTHDVTLDHAYLLCASSLVTVSLASLVLGLLTAGVIVLSRHCHINPDNVATPIAASLGDITSLSLLSWVATLLYDSIGTQDWLAPLIIAAYLLVIPLWIWIARRHWQTRDVLYHGWTPVVGAMLISSVGGLILDRMVARFEGIAVYQPVINGVGGNLVAVQASRISTALHRRSVLGQLTPEDSSASNSGVGGGGNHTRRRRQQGGDVESTAGEGNEASGTDAEKMVQATDKMIFISPVTAFCGKGPHARTTRVLMAMVVPGHLIFVYVIDYMKGGEPQLSGWFVLLYLFASVIQVATLLYCAYIMIHWMWRRRIDPDNSAIPYLTSMGDLLGISLLAVAFQFLYLIGDHRELTEDHGVR